ncbi:hypothetical protein Tco_1056684 [Tanacetum coccineum]|uniref:Uncharacterized protein n=1 Tax=Tanacetum coccineum TaxID=301880 RepID=A0ABQ5H554_9ASTR
MYYPRFTKIVVNYVMEKDDPMFTTINVISRNEATQLYGAILPVTLTNEDIRNSESYKEYYAMASGTIPPKTKGSKKKANTDAIPKPKSSTAPKKKKSGTRKPKTSELENISEADLTRASNSKYRYDDDEEMTESDNDGNDFAHPKLTTHDDEIIHEDETDEDDSSISSSDEDESDNDVEGAKLQCELLKTLIVTLTPLDPDGQHRVLPVSSGLLLHMPESKQELFVDDIFDNRLKTLLSLIILYIYHGAILTRPPHRTLSSFKPQQIPIMTPATTTSSLLENLPNFASLFGFDHRLKALEENFSEFRQTNQYADALSSIPGTVDQYLANKMQEAVDVAVQLKYDRIQEETTSANQKFLESIDDEYEEIIKEQAKRKSPR